MTGAAPGAGERARAALRTLGLRAQVVATAPGRVNLIGEHTDYSGGLVMPIAIDARCAAAACRGDAEPGTLRVIASDLGEECGVDLAAGVDPRGLPKWARYPVGSAALVRERRLERAGAGPGAGEVPAATLALASDVPIGAGLSSSAAVEVSSALAMSRLWEVELESRELALLAQRAEHEFAGVPCGVMDQFASVFAREGHALLLDCRSLSMRHAPLPPRVGRDEHAPRVRVLVVDSGVRHELAAGEYAKRRAACERAARAMGVAMLRDADEAKLRAAAGTLDDQAVRCALHVIRENRRVLELAGVLADLGEAQTLEARRLWGRAGEILLESHASLRHLFAVSCAEVDAIVEVLAGVGGVAGARMTGGGFGGSVVALSTEGGVGEAVRSLEAALGPGWGARVRVVQASGGAALESGGGEADGGAGGH